MSTREDLKKTLREIWQSGGAGREALREELIELNLVKVLSRTPGTDYSVGVGTPFLVQHPDGGSIYFLFTGWKNADGSGREVFIGEIDENLNVTNIRKLIAAGYPNTNFTSHDSVHVMYEYETDTWMLFTTSRYTPTGGWVACFFRFNSDFTEIVAEQCPALLSGAVWETMDCGVSPFRSAPKLAFFTYVDTNLNVRFGVIPDVTVSVPTFWGAGEHGHYTNRPAYGRVYDFLGGPDVHHTTFGSPHLISIMETNMPAGQWTLRPAFGFLHPGTGTYSGLQIQLGIASDPLLHGVDNSLLPATGHPHLTWLPRNIYPTLFFSFFATHPSYEHEIWAVRLPPEALNPKSYRALFYTPWWNYTVSTADERSQRSCWVPGFGKKITFYFKADKGGDLTIQVDPFGTYGVDTDWDAFDTITVTANTLVKYQTTYEAAFYRLYYPVDGAVVNAVAVVEP